MSIDSRISNSLIEFVKNQYIKIETIFEDKQNKIRFVKSSLDISEWLDNFSMSKDDLTKVIKLENLITNISSHMSINSVNENIKIYIDYNNHLTIIFEGIFS
jgi:hypothetical protein